MTQMDRIAAIEKSLSVFICGIVGFFPIIGFIPAICALVRWTGVRRNYHDWNPAAAYLKCGVMLAMIGLLNSALAALVIGLAISDSMIR